MQDTNRQQCSGPTERNRTRRQVKQGELSSFSCGFYFRNLNPDGPGQTSSNRGRDNNTDNTDQAGTQQPWIATTNNENKENMAWMCCKWELWRSSFFSSQVAVSSLLSLDAGC
mmetsp:Transcript_34273/g.53561  ORF Transcript_34273/g.53561 Transcript_34273/m.53561 type:complete len:113 (+) Transcript_34273:76-414(+)